MCVNAREVDVLVEFMAENAWGRIVAGVNQ